MTKTAERTTMAAGRSVNNPRLFRRWQFALSQPVAALVPRGPGRSHCTRRKKRDLFNRLATDLRSMASDIQGMIALKRVRRTSDIEKR